MNKKKHTIKDVKTLIRCTGFDIKKYNELYSMSDFEILSLLKQRMRLRGRESREYWFLEYFGIDDLDGVNNPTDEQLIKLASEWVIKMQDEMRSLFDSPLMIKDKTQVSYNSVHKILSLSHGNGVYPMDRGDVLSFIGEVRAIDGIGAGMPVIPSKEDLLKMENENSSFDDYLCESIDLLVQKGPHDNKKAHFVIDFEKSDKELIDAFAIQISKWRKELNIAPVSPPKTWTYIKERVLAYKVIPLMDLLYFSGVTGFAIPHRVLALALFPNGERDGFGLSQTVLPFIENYINDYSIYECQMQISK